MRWLAVLACAGCLAPPHPATGDGGPADGPGPVNHAFVTSMTGGLMLGTYRMQSDLDTLCMTTAAAAQIPGNYIAWVSTPNFSARDRLQGASGWIRSDGEPFALTAAALLDNGVILAPLRLDAFKRDVFATQTTPVIGTATRADGSYAGPTDCLTMNTVGTVQSGAPDGSAPWWTATGDTGITCSTPVQLYCLQIEYHNAPPMPAHTGRKVWVSTMTTLGNVGRAMLDGICQNELVAHGDSGQAIALVANSSQVPLDQITAGTDWVRPDGVVAITGATKKLVAPIDVTLDGAYIDARVWGGANAIDVVADAAGGDNCVEWTNGGLNAKVGRSSRSSVHEAYGGDANAGCGNALNQYHVYCIEP